MQAKIESFNDNHFFHFMNHPVVKGSILGAAAMTLVTPGVNRFNHGRSMRWSQAFTGWQPLAVSGMVGCGVSFYIKDILGGNDPSASSIQKSWTSAVAGAISGIAICPFEAVNHNHKKDERLANTVGTIIKHRGYSGLFHGTASMMVRESAWVMMYMMAVPTISEYLREKGYHRATADAFALIFSASMFGFVSAPVNRMRAMKHDGLVHSEKTMTYWQLASRLFHEKPHQTSVQKMANCFKGAGVRAATSGFAGALFYYGREGYDHIIQCNYQ